VQEIIERGGTGDEVHAAAINALPLLCHAGHTTKAVEYLLGNLRSPVDRLRS
jgi:hypothetical protein